MASILKGFANDISKVAKAAEKDVKKGYNATIGKAIAPPKVAAAAPVSNGITKSQDFLRAHGNPITIPTHLSNLPPQPSTDPHKPRIDYDYYSYTGLEYAVNNEPAMAADQFANLYSIYNNVDNLSPAETVEKYSAALWASGLYKKAGDTTNAQKYGSLAK